MTSLNRLMTPREYVTVPVPLGRDERCRFTVPLDMTPAEKARFLRIVTAWLDLTEGTEDV